MGLGRDYALVAVYLVIFSAKVVGDAVVSFFVTISFEISFSCDLQKLSAIRPVCLKVLEIDTSL